MGIGTRSWRLTGLAGALLLASTSALTLTAPEANAQAGYAQPPVTQPMGATQAAPATAAQPASAQATSAQPVAQAPIPPAQGGSAQIMLDVDAPTIGASIANGQGFFVGGWAIASGASITSVEVYLDSSQGTGTPIGFARLGGARPDVASALGQPAAATSGYNFNWIPRSVSAGPHMITVLARASNGQSATQQVQVTSCGCSGFVGSVTNPGVQKIGLDGYELDTGGPGTFFERPSESAPGGR
jgi:hypothetical protein